MSRTTMIYEPQPSGVGLGRLEMSSLGVKTDFSTLVPYAKGGEDIEVLLRYPGALRQSQPFEANGFKVHSLMKKALALQEELQDMPVYSDSADVYTAFLSDHPMLISYAPEVIWLGRRTGMEAWKSNLEIVLPTLDLGLDETMVEEIIGLIDTETLRFAGNYGFWKFVIDKRIACIDRKGGTDKGERLVRVLLDWSIQNAVNSKAKWMAGLIPIIDMSTPGSVTLSHRVNLAYAHLIDARLDEGKTAPAYLYTIYLNSTMLPDDNWTSMLSTVVRNARLALASAEFDGLYLGIRNLEQVSMRKGRVNTLIKLIREINEIAESNCLPTWYGRLGPLGLAILDEGGTFSSFPLNSNIGDVFTNGGRGNKLDQFGKVFNPVVRERWDRQQVMAAIAGPDGGLPRLDSYWSINAPSGSELDNPVAYRVNFSKPYTLGAMNMLMNQWIDDIRSGEEYPGRAYLESAEPIYSSWGPR